MTEFEWRTADDGSWERPHLDDQVQIGPEEPRPWPFWLFALVLLVVIAGGVIYFALNRQVDRVVDTGTVDVLAAHLLVRQAAAENDRDLLATMLVGEEPSWVELQTTLIRTRLFLGRERLGLSYAPELEPTQERPPPEITLAPDLQSAEVVEQVPYRVRTLEGGSATVNLAHYFRYQKVGQSWLLAPTPEEADFWGRWVTVENEEVTFIFPARDEDVGLRLWLDLQALVADICESEYATCAPNFHLRVQLEREAFSLTRLNEYQQHLHLVDMTDAYHVLLPAPTLVGRPVDDAGYQALYRGYASWLARLLVTTLGPLANEAAAGQVVEGSELKEMLAGWGLTPPPLPYEPLPEPAPLSAERPASALPEQDALLLCNVSYGLRLLRYNPRTNRWAEELAGGSELVTAPQPGGGATMYPLPDDSGVLVDVYQPGVAPDGDWQVYLYRPGEERRLGARPGEIFTLPPIYQRQIDPAARYLFISVVGGRQGAVEQIGLLDWRACVDEGDCAFRYTPGLPYWSPDHAYSLVLDLFGEGVGLRLLTGDGEEAAKFENSYGPRWIDLETFLFLRSADQGPGGSELVLGTVDDPEALRVVLAADELRAAFEGSERPGQLGITSASAILPGMTMVLTAQDGETDMAYLFAIEGLGGDVRATLLANLGEMQTGLGLVSTGDEQGEGGYLAFAGYVRNDFSGTGWAAFALELPLDLDNPSLSRYRVPGGTFDWSADGQWLLVPVESGLRIVSPADDFERLVPYDVRSCNSTFWVNAGPE